MNAIETEMWSVWFSVETAHGFRIAAMLEHFEEQNKLPHATLTDRLWDDFHKEFEADKGVAVVKYDLYAAIQFMLEAPSAKELEDALPRCIKVVQAWLDFYDINNWEDEQ